MSLTHSNALGKPETCPRLTENFRKAVLEALNVTGYLFLIAQGGFNYCRNNDAQ